MSNAPRQMPCPDCGSPVQPARDQLCPRCGYPLMFLRQEAEDDARAVPRAPNERDDATGLQPTPAHHDTRQVQPATYGHPAADPGQLRCPQCGYGNEAPRIRCERCGHELRPARPQAVVLGPPVRQTAPRSGTLWWLITLIVLAVIAVVALGVTLVWDIFLR